MNTFKPRYTEQKVQNYRQQKSSQQYTDYSMQATNIYCWNNGTMQRLGNTAWLPMMLEAKLRNKQPGHKSRDASIRSSISQGPSLLTGGHVFIQYPTLQ